MSVLWLDAGMERRGRTSRGLGWPWGHAGAGRGRLGWPGRAPHSEQSSSDSGLSSEGDAGGLTANAEINESPLGPTESVTPSQSSQSSTAGERPDVSRETPASPHDDRESTEPGPQPDVSRGTESDAAPQLVDGETPRESGDLADLDDDSTPLATAIALDVRRRSTLVGAPLPRPAATRVLTVANQKGGVGKTTSAVNIAAALAQSGMRVLVIDLDPQGNASTALGVDHRSGIDSIYDVVVDGVPMSSVVVESPSVTGLFCAPSTIDLAGAEIELVSLVAREGRLAKALEAHLADTAYDYVFIDCPPSLGLLTVNAFVAAREVFIPIQCEYYALEGLSQLLRNVELIKTHLNPRLEVSTILLTMFDGRTRLSAQVAEEVRAHFPAQTLRTTIPRSVRVSEAPSFGETVMTYDPLSSGALAYLEAANQIAHRDAGSTTEGADS